MDAVNADPAPAILFRKTEELRFRPRRIRAGLLSISLLALSSCEKVYTNKTYFLAGDLGRVVVEIEVDNVPLAEETYKLTLERGDKSWFFLKGSNPRRFNLKFKDDVIFVDFCYGNIETLRPIYVRPPVDKLIGVQVQTVC